MGIAQYLTDLNGRILSEKVCGSNIKIDAYAIGLQGKDVQDVDAFKNNLKKLSSSEDKMFEANDMDEVNETFNNIARSLYSATSIFSMTFNIPMPSNGEVIRFTFDNVEKAEDSKCYIEGTYKSRNLEDLKFEGCLYQGPAVISGVKSGVEMSFSFEGLSDMNNEQLPRTNIQNFKKSSVNGIWQLNSEFDGNSNVEIEEEQKTAVVMLVLDCSSSLGDDFARMKSAANNFISLLLNASEQNNTVSFDANGGTGSMSSMTFGKGETKTLTANTFTRTGYTFTGWNTKADGTGISYTNKHSITPTENLTLYAQWEESKGTGTANGHEWVDLGLPSGTKWATTNVGATTPEGYGNYYAWGETTTKSTYNWSTYKWCNGNYDTMTKYCTESSYGTVDNKTTLDLSDDAAYVNWGSSWRMPTKAEQYELRTECTWTWTTQNGVNGYKVTSKTNGNSIFLPAAGYRSGSSVNYAGSTGLYWSSSLDAFSYFAEYLYFSSSNVGGNNSYGFRYYCQSVRPVLR